MRRCSPSRLLLCACGLLAAVAAETRGQEPAKPRLYAHGRLTAADFQAEVPADRESRGRVLMSAETKTEIRYKFQYSVMERRGRYTVVLDSIDVFALMLTDRSWLAAPENTELISHEQGHFDIAHLRALRVQAAFEEQIRGGRAPRATGRTVEEAAAALNASIREVFGPWIAEMQTADAEYDAATGHGTLRKAQAEFDRRLAAELAEAEAALNER